MKVVHAFWLPEPGTRFFQNGDFHLWVETSEPASERPPRNRHPRHLSAKELRALLAELGIAAGADRFVECTLTLPGYDGAPMACPELAPYLERDNPEQGEPGEWNIACWRLAEHPVGHLNEVHFQSIFRTREWLPGADFLFWYWFTQSLKAILFKDAYIPSLRLHAGTGGDYELYAGCEFLADTYETLIQEAAERMPPSAGPGYEAESLLRHCSEVLLQRSVTGARLTQALAKRIQGSPMEACLRGEPREPWQTTRDLTLYRQWCQWRRRLAGERREAGFQLCLQLHEAGETEPDRWRLEFRVAACRDFSLQLALEDYWAMSGAGRQALVKNFGRDFEKNLLLRLGQAARIYPDLWKGLESDRPTVLDLSLEQAFEFLNETAWVLEDAGFRVIVPAWWTPQGRRRAKLRMRGSGSARKPAAVAAMSGLSLDRLLEYRYELTLGGETVSAEEWEQLVETKTPLVRFRGQWVALDRDRMREMLAFWKAQGETGETLNLPEFLRRSAEENELFEVEPEDACAAMLAKLRDHRQLEPVDDPPRLNASLREYQKRGVAWLRLLERLGLCGCLADDMGLGKTIQVIARLVLEKEEEDCAGPNLLIVPTSVIGNWQKEIERFAPQLATHIHHGSGRTQDEQPFREECARSDVVITSYTLLRKDAGLFSAIRWRRVVLDEAQNIKNPVAAQTKAVLQLDAGYRLALTGTPVENRLLDLWSIFNFLNPGYLGKQAQFRKNYEQPIQRDNDLAKSALLKKLVEPFILRRVKTDPAIIKDLPAKVENRQFCNLSREQASLYESLVRDVERQLEESEGIQRQGLMLSTLMKLKQICNHPAQFLQDGSPFTADRSHKLERLLDMLGEVLGEGESALVFTQFTEIGDSLERQLRATLQCRTYYLHGGTSRNRRERMIAQFQDPESPPSIFILSLKAGGVGITLTRANHVFHFDRWWNPAVEDQATDRAFRIGQTRNVFVHKFITLGTLEERIDRMIEDKKQVAGTIVGSDESWLAKLDNESFRQLIALNRQAVLD
ncbi:DNA/RNA helicase, superfamily II, SNF2 family [Methylocaldum marinum]|uniref:DNA/RNA helicase, superfamily II, SNF2 family n=1 Tax=Methylocaldum marinum TaxID=1432792 RepID=A0A250KTV4_9GAMM|nr:DEAD/DEAH box helicase [Methylocaldum marinum]BBA34966.1 DNA/RNA helicase, superfamily II, SNF2 family [Methylocaldum marinum]